MIEEILQKVQEHPLLVLVTSIALVLLWLFRRSIKVGAKAVPDALLAETDTAVPLSKSERTGSLTIGAIFFLAAAYSILAPLIQRQGSTGSQSTHQVAYTISVALSIPLLLASVSILLRRTKTIRKGESPSAPDRSRSRLLVMWYCAVAGSLSAVVFAFFGLVSIEPRLQFASLVTTVFCVVAAGWGVVGIRRRSAADALWETKASTVGGEVTFAPLADSVPPKP